MTDHPRTMLLIDADEAQRMIEQAVARALEARLPAPDPRPWRTRAGMAEALGVNVATVTRMAARGDLETKGAGSGRRYRERV